MQDHTLTQDQLREFQGELNRTMQALMDRLGISFAPAPREMFQLMTQRPTTISTIELTALDGELAHNTNKREFWEKGGSVSNIHLPSQCSSKLQGKEKGRVRRWSSAAVAVEDEVAGSYGLPPTPARRALFILYQTAEYVMEFCEKSLVNVLERRGAGYFEEKQVLTIFRDVCNALFAMHRQSHFVAHSENLLLGADGSWKLCDFGSISTNHKRFERPEEMGIEEDNE
ncbi:hypothetical protein Syun_007603 [Stephania yunnanensis]|uniref:non-specific serine/threonine protein kinase n=1 Tax=Stephania yunnanensis TaxID=152371 RepID=A0AAP0KYQ3_9MAGN